MRGIRMSAREQHSGFDVERINLAEVGLPVFDEPIHPRLQQYAHERTRQWRRPSPARTPSL